MEITAQELKQKLAAGEKLLLLDVREPWEHEEFNLGGRLMPLGELMNSLWDMDEQKNEEIVVYCRSGSRSGMAQAMMAGNGFTNVRNLSGGILAWEQEFGLSKP